MKRMRTIIFHSLIVAVVTQGMAQSRVAKAFDAARAEPLPTIDQILDKYVEALGGKAKLEKLTTRVTKGSADLPGAGGIGSVEIYMKAPNKWLFVLNNPDLTVNATGFNGTAGWSQDSDSGVQDLKGDDLSLARRGAEFYRDIKLKELYPKMTVKSKEKVDDHDAYVIEATSADGGPQETWYFDTRSGLLIRRTWEQHTPDGITLMEVSFDDYKEVDGVKVPFTLRQSFSDDFLTIRLGEVRHEFAIDDAKFNKPAAQ